jgi:UDP-N-acetylmuramate--alanine ligase
MPENATHRVHRHFMGIGGQGISAVAQMTQQREGTVVTGCDRHASATTRALETTGIPVQIGHSADHLTGVDTLVISPAVPALDPHNVELVAARERGLRIVTWQELFGELIAGQCLLSVSGVHGKGTITAMLSLMLTDAGFDPTCEIGAVVPRFGANYRLGKSVYVVNEADEFNHNFWHYHPRLVIVSSIEFEHPEFFANYDAYLAAYEHFIRGMDIQGHWSLPPTLVVNRDSEGCLDLLARLHDWSGRVILYGVEGFVERVQPVERHDARHVSPVQEQHATFEAYDVRLDGETSFRVRVRGEDVVNRAIHLRLPGIHNIQNALAALAAAQIMDADPATLVSTLETFSGTRRRFDIRHEGPLQVDGRMVEMMLVDDYAHHPTAIALTLEAARRRYPGRRLVAVYQPHMYSRTKVFFEQFLRAFDEADVAIIASIFPAREQDTGLVSSQELVEAMSTVPHFARDKAVVLHGGSVEETIALLSEQVRPGDLVLVMGAGDIYMVTERLLTQGQQGRAHDIRA